MSVAEQMQAYPHMAGECGFVELSPGYGASIDWLDRVWEQRYYGRILLECAGEWRDE